jgi:hypothetical protein
MPSKGTTRRTVRVDDELWESALDEAEQRGEMLAEAIRRFLRAYVEHRD